jgi:hypothetical protein
MNDVGTSDFLWGVALAVPFFFVALALHYVYLTRPSDHHPHPGE